MDSLSSILNIFLVIDLSLILFYTSTGIYQIPTAKFLSINNETQCAPLLILSLRFLT